MKYSIHCFLHSKFQLSFEIPLAIRRMMVLQFLLNAAATVIAKTSKSIPHRLYFFCFLSIARFICSIGCLTTAIVSEWAAYKLAMKGGPDLVQNLGLFNKHCFLSECASNLSKIRNGQRIGIDFRFILQ